MTDFKTINVNKTELPKNWNVAKLEDLSTVILGQSPSSSSYNVNGEGLAFFQGKAEFGAFYPKTVKWCTEPKKTALKNDILFSVRAPVGPTNLSPTECCIGRGLAALRPNEGVLYKYLLFYLRSIESNIESLGTGTTFRAITGVILKNLPVSVAPQNEQKSIVEEIEKQFSRLDEAVDNLKRVKANLKRYKASVLKAAVEGKLTEEWREANPDVESADKLLERILAERRKKWEETELAKMKAKGKVPKDDKWKKKYKKPDVADQIDMKLPNGWAIATVKQLSERVQYGSSSKTSESSDGIPVLRMGNIFEGKLLLDKLKYLPESHDEFPELVLESDDLLFNRTNSPELVGKTAVYKGKPLPCSFASYLIRARFIHGVNPNFIGYFINSNYGRKWIKSVVSQQVGQANVNGTKLQALSVPLPPDIEQGIIVSEVENKFSIIDGIEKEIARNLIRADRLRQSILNKAFSGKLVPQRNNDESVANPLKQSA